MAAASSATPAWRVGTWPPAATTRSSQPAPAVPATISGRSSRSSRNALVRRPRANHHGRLRQRPAQPRARLGAIPAPADDLGDRCVVVRRDDVAHGNTRLDAHPRPRGQREQLDRSRRGGEATLGVLGVEPGLDRVAERGRRLALQVPARGDVDLQLHEVEPGRHLGDDVLRLQAHGEPGEREGPLVGSIEELDGPGAAVADRPGQVDGRRPQLAFLLGAERPASSTPRSASGCRARIEHSRAPAAQTAPCASAKTCTPTRCAPAAAASSVAAPASTRRPACSASRFTPASSPRRRMTSGGGPMKTMPDARAQLGEGGILGDEAPAHPGGVGAARPERPLELAVVAVGARPGDHHGLVGLAHEHRPLLGLGVQRDRPHRPAVLEVELPHRADHAHRGVGAVDDRDAAERRVSRRRPLGHLPAKGPRSLPSRSSGRGPQPARERRRRGRPG